MLRAQALRVQAITVADGLSQGYISALFEDRRGFMWIGTFNGLNRYDGYGIKRFIPDFVSPWSIKGNFIYCIAEDPQGLLWIGTDKGPVVMDPSSERFVHLPDFIPALPAVDVPHIICEPGGKVWICHRQPGKTGILALRPPADLLYQIRESRIAPGEFELKQVQLSAELTGPLVWLSRINDSILIAADLKNRLCRIDTARMLARASASNTLPFTRMGNYGLLYVAPGRYGFVFQLLEVNGSWPNNVKQYADFVQMPGEAPILVRHSDTTLRQMDTLASGLQLVGYHRTGFYEQFPPFITLDLPMSYAYTVDRSGNLWVGTSGYGVRKISRNKLDFSHYLPQHSIYNFTVLPDGRIWPGIHNRHEVLNLQTGRLEPAPWASALSDKAWLYNLLISRTSDWWMITALKEQLSVIKKNAGSNTWSQQAIPLTYFKDIPLQMLEDRRGAIWISGNRGELVRIGPENRPPEAWNIGHLFAGQQAEQLRSTSLAEDPSGTLWIGTSQGLIRVNKPEGEPVFTLFQNRKDAPLLFGNDWVLSIFPDTITPGLLWVGTRDGGLSRLDSRTGKAEIFMEKQGLANNVVYGILPDDAGHLWLSTNRGLSRFNPSNRSIVNFQQSVPEINIEFNTNAYHRLPSGELAFGSISGLFLIRPENERRAVKPGAVTVTGIKINGQELDFSCDDGCLQFQSDNSMALHLPSDRNNVALEFAALQSSDPSVVQYRYRLKGSLGDQWIMTGLQHDANLAGLPPGRYVLELQAKSPDDDWERSPVSSVFLTIRPPWYRGWPAWLVYALIAFLLVRLYVRFVRKQLALEHAVELSQKETEQLKALDDFKNRFFAYVTHEFKTPLTIILGLAARLSREKLPASSTANARNIVEQG